MTHQILGGFMAQSMEETYWADYVEAHFLPFVQALPKGDLKARGENVGDDDVEELKRLGPKKSFKLLEACFIPAEAVKVLSGRFSAYKYRQKNNVTTIKVTQNSRQKIEAFMQKSQSDTVDEAIDYLFNPQYNKEAMTYVRQLDNTLFSDEVGGKAFENLLSRLTLRDCETVRIMLELACSEAFKRGRETKKGKRNAFKEWLAKDELMVAMDRYIG